MEFFFTSVHQLQGTIPTTIVILYWSRAMRNAQILTALLPGIRIHLKILLNSGEFLPMEWRLNWHHGPCSGSHSSWIFCTRYTGGFPPMQWTMELCELGNPGRCEVLILTILGGNAWAMGNGEELLSPASSCGLRIQLLLPSRDEGNGQWRQWREPLIPERYTVTLLRG